MRKELEEKLVERWPTWFNTKGDVHHTLMSWGFVHDDGWFDILWRLCEDLEPLVAEFEATGECQFEILQVKEKFGGLRIHVNNANDNIRLYRNCRTRVFPHLRSLRATGNTTGRRLD
jgi:hypothetical protein